MTARPAAAPLCDDAPVDAGGNQIVGAVQDWAFARCVPLNGTIELTLRCNIRCVHCYNFDRTEADPCAEEPELSTEEILKVISELRTAGCLFLQLTGGEALAHPALFTFLDHARSLNMAVQLLSNGTLLRPGTVGKLAGYRNLLGVSVSVYGATAETHDGVTQSPGSFRRTWDGMERLRAKGIAVRMKIIVLRQNAHEVAAMRAQAAERGLPFLIDFTVTGRHDGTSGSLGARVSEEQLAALYEGPLRDLAPRGVADVTDEQFACNCARGNVAIGARGDVFPCISVPWSAGNVRRQPFAEIWRDSPVFQKIRGLKADDYAQCGPCDKKAWCMRPRGAAFTASGDYTGVDTFVCTAADLARRLNPRP